MDDHADPTALPPSLPTDSPLDVAPLGAAVVRLGRAHRALTSQLVREVGLRPDQAVLMMHLWSVGPVRQKALADHFGRDSASTTRTVQRLEHAGYVRRRTDPTDRRATLVEPTAAGHALRATVEGIWVRLEHVLSDGLGPDERAAALPLLLRLGDLVLEELGADPTTTLEDL